MVENTLTVGKISEGFVLDHIEAGKSMEIYKYLHLDKLDCCVAIIKNAKSNKMGKKDIMKIECPIDFMDLDILGFIDETENIQIHEVDRAFNLHDILFPHLITFCIFDNSNATVQLVKVKIFINLHAFSGFNMIQYKSLGNLSYS